MSYLKIERISKTFSGIAIIAFVIYLFVTMFTFATYVPEVNVNDKKTEKESSYVSILPKEVLVNEAKEMVHKNKERIEQEKAKEKEIHYTEFIATAYCACEKCCGKWALNRPDGIVKGAAGRELIGNYSIAVDPKVIPYGTLVYDENGNEYRADDCGGAVKGNHIDIYMSSHEAARNWGKQTIKIYW